jgi:dienelactone hydrolase
MRCKRAQASRRTRRDFLQSAALGLTAQALLAGKALARSQTAARATGATSPAVTTDSDVGSLFPFIQSQAPKDFKLSYLRPEYKSVGSWKKVARGKLLELLHYSPAKCDPRAETVEKVDCGEYIREKVYFNTTPDIRVPAFVLIPKNAPKPAPAIVALHDHGGFYFWGKEKIVELESVHPVLAKFKETSYSGKSIASDLARQGYVVIVIDMFYWGERRLLLDDDQADWRERPANITAERIRAFNQRASQNEQLLGRTIFAAGFTWSGVMYWDDVRTVDYLVTRPEVDKKRIGCVGLSVGGLRTCHLAALDDRIKAAVAVGWMTSFPAQLRKQVRNSIGFTKIVPGLYQYLDYPDVTSLAMPAALLVINGSKDALFAPDGVRASFDKLNACYTKAGIPDKCRTRMYDTPHEFNSEMQAEAWAWLKKWL